MNSIKVFVPATIGNIGPGFDVLGLAIQKLGDTIEAKKISGNKLIIEKIENSDKKISNDPKKNTAGISAQHVLDFLESKQGISLKIIKGLPSGSGLGSSAASAVGGAAATNLLLGNKLSKHQTLQSSMAGEYIVSGGYFADNVAPAIYGGATLTNSLNPLQITPLGIISDLLIILAIPQLHVLTKNSRKVIPSKIKLEDHIINMANTASITAAFCKNDYNILKNNLFDYVIEPTRSKLIPGFADVKEAAINAGADNMTISGSGPTLFSITNSMAIAKKIEKNMKAAFTNNNIECNTLITKSSRTGIKII